MLSHLQLHRPVVFLDVETTGVDPRRDRIIELAMTRFAPGESSRSYELRFHPERPIPPAASAVHGIQDTHVAGCPTFAQCAKRIKVLLGKSDLAGFGIIRFDLPFLFAEFERAGCELHLRGRKIVDVLSLFHRLCPRDLAAAVRQYCGRDHEHAHSARSDVAASAAVLNAMLAKHKDLPRTVHEIHELLIPVDIEGWFRREHGTIVFARGKHRGTSLVDVARCDASYLGWLSGHVLPDTRGILQEVMQQHCA